MEHRLLPINEVFYLMFREDEAAMLLLDPVTSMAKARQFANPNRFIQKRLIQALQRGGSNLVLAAAVATPGEALVGHARVENYRCAFTPADDAAADTALGGEKLVVVRTAFQRALVVCAQEEERIGRRVWGPWLQWGRTERPDLVDWNVKLMDRDTGEPILPPAVGLLMQAASNIIANANPTEKEVP